MGCTSSSPLLETLKDLADASTCEAVSREKWKFEMGHPSLKTWEHRLLDYVARGRRDELQGFPLLRASVSNYN